MPLPEGTAPVTDLAGDRERAQLGDAPEGAQAVHGLGKRWRVVPDGQVGSIASSAASRPASTAR
jgi:hypothetical protein